MPRPFLERLLPASHSESRTTMSNSKRPPDDSSSAPNPSKKAIKIKYDEAPVDYSSDVRKKLQSSNRTGQACDRCRVGTSHEHGAPTQTGY